MLPVCRESLVLKKSPATKPAFSLTRIVFICKILNFHKREIESGPSMAAPETPKSTTLRHAFGNVLSLFVLLLIGALAFSIRLFSVNPLLPSLHATLYSASLCIQIHVLDRFFKYKKILVKSHIWCYRIVLLGFWRIDVYIFNCLVIDFLLIGYQVRECNSWIRSLLQL